MGYDITFHLVDERQIREVLVPTLIGKQQKPPPALKKDPEGAKLWKEMRKLFASGEADDAAGALCELALIFSACSLPYHYERGFGLSIWEDAWRAESVKVTRYPARYRFKPDPLFAEAITARRELEGQFPTALDGSCLAGVFIPAAKVKEVRAWIEKATAELSPLHRKYVAGLLKMLALAQERRLALWEGNDLAIPAMGTAPGDPSLMSAKVIRTKSTAKPLTAKIPHYCTRIAGIEQDTLVLKSGGVGRDVTVFADLRSWPPRFVTRTDIYAFRAARVPETGEWLLACRNGLQLLAAAEPKGVVTPLPRDAETQSVQYTKCGVVGERMVAFLHPLDYSEERRVAIREPGGSFTFAKHLPPTLSCSSGDPEMAAGTARTHGGQSIFILNGDGYALSRGRAKKVYALNATATYLFWSYVPSGEDGFYYISGGKLFVVSGPGKRPIPLLPRLDNIKQIAAGPADWVILHEGDNSRDDFAKIYIPSTGKLIYLNPRDFDINDDVDFVTYASVTRHFILVTGGGSMRAIPRDRVAALPQRKA
jgi:hypothetical protein